ncbi:MAG: efflux RND transporter periplasmic adaptor subunit, partial [Acidobacteriota bacterium]
MVCQTRVLSVVVLGYVLLSGAGCAKGKPADSVAVATRPPVAVSVAPVVQADLQESVEIVGTLEPKFAVDVKSEVTGTVTNVYVTEWVPVRKGDRLAHLDTRESDAGIDALKAAVAQAKVAESRAEREFERAKQLKEFGLITPQNFDDAKSAVDAAQAAVTSANAQVKAAESHLSKSNIMSPMDGVVALRGVSVGDRVENMGSGSPLFR